MKKLIITILISAVPLMTFAASYTLPWNATTTTGTIFTMPAPVNGTRPIPLVPYIVATSTTSTSTFAGGITANYLTVTNPITNGNLANSTIGLTSSGSITIGTSPISLGGTSALNLNMANANTWTALQTFGNASTTQISSTGGAYFATTGSNVGIGNTNPRALLDVLSGTANTAGDTPGYFLLTSPATAVSNGNLTLQSNDAQGANVGPSFVFGARYTTGSTASAAFASILGAKENSTTNNLNGYLSFFTRKDGSTYDLTAERMRIDSNGNVGIGTTDPISKLHVKQSSDTVGVRLEASNNDSIFLINNTIGTGWRINATYGSTGSYQPVAFLTSDTERMRISTNGNIGIGTTTPYAKLSVVETAGGVNPIFSVASSTNTVYFAIGTNGHQLTGGQSPTISSCGTDPSIAGDDSTARIKVGGGSVTSCTVTFASSWKTTRNITVTPICIVEDESAAATRDVAASSTPTSVVISSGVSVAGDFLSLKCWASNNFTY